MPWLSKLKVAIAEKNIENINELIENLPQFETIDELDEAQYLFKEVYLLINGLKDETQSSMQRIQKNLSFMRSTEVKPTTALDIKS